MNLEEPLDSITFNAALCLGYLDKSDPIAQETMFMFLTHVERKKRFQVGKPHVNAEIEAAFLSSQRVYRVPQKHLPRKRKGGKEN